MKPKSNIQSDCHKASKGLLSISELNSEWTDGRSLAAPVRTPDSSSAARTLGEQRALSPSGPLEGPQERAFPGHPVASSICT